MALGEDRSGEPCDAALPRGGGMNTGLVASVHARLLARAKERGEDFNLILTRYGVERFLYRLSISPPEKAPEEST